jgi:hypothetical protein
VGRADVVDDERPAVVGAVRPRDDVLLGQAQYPAGLDEIVILQRLPIGLMHATVEGVDLPVAVPIAQETGRDRAEGVAALHHVEHVIARHAQCRARQWDEQDLAGIDQVGVDDRAADRLVEAARGAQDGAIVGQAKADGNVI